MKKGKLKIINIIITIIIFVLIFIMVSMFLNKEKEDENNNVTMIDLSSYTYDEIAKYANDNKLNFELKEEYSFDYEIGSVISQNILKDTIIKEGDLLIVTISKGEIPASLYSENAVNELGNVPIMMYHGIENKENNATEYTGGNVDKDGYNRTKEAFINDLEMYYEEGYRMIRLIDYINGTIDVELGKSPIILTFDDGNINNIKVNGLDDNGNIIIDPNSAIGILETFKKQYPDFNVTATFFVNGSLFNQSEYNDKILNWLVENGYDIGNHTYNHDNLSTISSAKTAETIAKVYQKLDDIIPNKYVKIIALPFGSPYTKTHANFNYVLNGSYNDYTYETIGALRVGWEANVSSFNKNFDPTFIKRVRAYDNDGKDFDIKMTFNSLKTTKYISDGNKDTVVIPESKSNLLIEIDKRVIKY